MSTIKKIQRGKILAQADEGVLVPYMALTKRASVTIEGEALANRVFLATSHALWNMKIQYQPVFRVTGLVSGGAITPGVADNVLVAAGVANVNGTQVAFNADATNTLTRGTAGKYMVNAITVNAAGAVSVTVGAEGASLDLTGGFGGAGQKPLVAVTEAVIGYVSMYDSGAAVVATGEIYAGDNANITPDRIDGIRGGLVFGQALEANRTGNIPRTVYAQFYELTNSLLPLFDFIEGDLTVTTAAPIVVNLANTMWTNRVSVGTKDWSLVAKKAKPDQFWATKTLDPAQDAFLLKFYEDSADTGYFIGYGILNSPLKLSNKRGAAMEDLSFVGDGELVQVAA